MNRDIKIIFFMADLDLTPVKIQMSLCVVCYNHKILLVDNKVRRIMVLAFNAI